MHANTYIAARTCPCGSKQHLKLVALVGRAIHSIISQELGKDHVVFVQEVQNSFQFLAKPKTELKALKHQKRYKEECSHMH